MEVDIKGGMPNSDVCLLINMYCYVYWKYGCLVLVHRSICLW